MNDREIENSIKAVMALAAGEGPARDEASARSRYPQADYEFRRLP